MHMANQKKKKGGNQELPHTRTHTRLSLRARWRGPPPRGVAKLGGQSSRRGSPFVFGGFFLVLTLWARGLMGEGARFGNKIVKEEK